jgi:SpoVK/Ycf46/Vps4 family AAA+-type ATPase
VLPPDARARRAIIEYHLRGRPTAIDDLGPVVTATDGFSGADLRLVCNEAAQRVMADAAQTGVARPITIADLSAVAQLMLPSTTPWMETARNFATYANSSGDYDELLTYLKSRGRK